MERDPVERQAEFAQLLRIAVDETVRIAIAVPVLQDPLAHLQGFVPQVGGL